MSQYNGIICHIVVFCRLFRRNNRRNLKPGKQELKSQKQNGSVAAIAENYDPIDVKFETTAEKALVLEQESEIAIIVGMIGEMSRIAARMPMNKLINVSNSRVSITNGKVSWVKPTKHLWREKMYY